jgi:hypothetical protein
MIAKIISVIVVVVAHAAGAFMGFGIMLLSMNGYNDAAAEAAMPAYGIAQVIFIIGTGILTLLGCWFFQNKLEWNAAGSAALSIGISLVIAVIATFIAMGIGMSFGDAAFRR